MIAASNVYTIQNMDRTYRRFSPIPAMSMISYASGARMLQLMGGVALSFYDWYCDLPPAPRNLGEQTDVAESADWYNAKMIAVAGSNLAMTRTPDVHFAVEARHNGSKLWVFSRTSARFQVRDEWIAINAGRTGRGGWRSPRSADEFHHSKDAVFPRLCQEVTDAPYLSRWPQGWSVKAGRCYAPTRVRLHRPGERRLEV